MGQLPQLQPQEEMPFFLFLTIETAADTAADNTRIPTTIVPIFDNIN